MAPSACAYVCEEEGRPSILSVWVFGIDPVRAFGVKGQTMIPLDAEMKGTTVLVIDGNNAFGRAACAQPGSAT